MICYYGIFLNSEENKNESLVMFDFSRERAREVNKSEFMSDFYSSYLIQPHSSDKGILIKKTSVWITLKNSYSGVEPGPLRSAKHGHKCHKLSSAACLDLAILWDTQKLLIYKHNSMH